MKKRVIILVLIYLALIISSAFADLHQDLEKMSDKEIEEVIQEANQILQERRAANSINEKYDLSKYSDSELLDLNKRLLAYLGTKSPAKKDIIHKGEYVAGTNIPTGCYIFTKPDDNSTTIEVWSQTMEHYSSPNRYYIYLNDPDEVACGFLEEGNVLRLNENTVMTLSKHGVLFGADDVMSGDGTDSEINELTDEEYDQLLVNVQNEIVSRKIVLSVHVNPGSYKVGINIPAGNYKITLPEGDTDSWYADAWSAACVSERGTNTTPDKNIDSLYYPEDAAYIQLEEGDIIEFERNAVFTIEGELFNQ